MKTITLKKIFKPDLFKRYSLWSFFSIMINYLFYDFINLLKSQFDADTKITILKDKEYRLDLLKKDNWVLIKNNSNSINGKLRFLIDKNEFEKLIDNITEKYLYKLFKTTILRLKKITFINEIDNITADKFYNPERLGNIEKYFVVNFRINLLDNNYFFLFIIRDEMLFFPLSRISTDFILQMDKKYFKKAFVELDKKIIYNGFNCCSDYLKNKFLPFIDKNNNFKLSEDMDAYKLLIQYLHILNLYSKDVNF